MNQKNSKPEATKIRLPRVGIFDIPSGCSARTDDWIFPASTEGKFEITLQPLTAPSINISFPIKRSELETAFVIELPKKNDSALNQISELLARNTWATASTEMTSQQIKRLLSASKSGKGEWSSENYSTETISGLAVMLFVMIAMGLTLLWLYRKYKKNKTYNTLPITDPTPPVIELQLKSVKAETPTTRKKKRISFAEDKQQDNQPETTPIKTEETK